MLDVTVARAPDTPFLGGGPRFMKLGLANPAGEFGAYSPGLGDTMTPPGVPGAEPDA